MFTGDRSVLWGPGGSWRDPPREAVHHPTIQRCDALSDELTELAAHIAAATHRFLVLLEEFDRLKGWADAGCRSCAHWLAWRCGMSLRTARDHLRVARALPELPKVSAAFARGTIPPEWYGEPVNYRWAVEVLIDRQGAPPKA